ncbi:hypothetical protein SLEP1_g58638 [Rubroshorea leprosula]|uniref:Uncharacterized protein n=1 Tax=Rubroshorea leprosula TaxID=152421 RepID=A0AAV5MQ26_9ROSI|nr:hypothetical protein SLEP1_g58638 [Rubroshorea leprosula]
MRYGGSRKKPVPLGLLLFLCATFTVGLLILTLRSVDPSPPADLRTQFDLRNPSLGARDDDAALADAPRIASLTWAFVEEMGEVFQTRIFGGESQSSEDYSASLCFKWQKYHKSNAHVLSIMPAEMTSEILTVFLPLILDDILV